jgi:hypothetical protein
MIGAMQDRTMPAAERAVAARYGSGAMAFHWVMVVLVVVVGVLGLLHDSWPRTTQAFWINVHALIGLAVWVLVMMRIGWRLRHPPPALPAEAGDFSRRWSYPVHWISACTRTAPSLSRPKTSTAISRTRCSPWSACICSPPYGTTS